MDILRVCLDRFLDRHFPDRIPGTPMVAFSGGRDSTVLAWALSRHPACRNRLILLHVDHALRPAGERWEELSLVENTARSFGCGLECMSLEEGAVEELAAHDGGGMEAAARKLRYQALETMARKHGGGPVFLAHHRDDDRETFLMALFRGQAADRRIQEVRGNFYRPLISLPGEILAGFARDNGLRWHEDTTNKTDDYLRNRIRNHLVPVLDEIFPGWQDSVGTLRDRLAGEKALMEQVESLPPWKECPADIPCEGGKPGPGARGMTFGTMQALPDMHLLWVLETGARPFLESGEIDSLPGMGCLAAVRRWLDRGGPGLLQAGSVRLVRYGDDVCLSPRIVAMRQMNYGGILDGPEGVEIPGTGLFLVREKDRHRYCPLRICSRDAWIGREDLPDRVDIRKMLALQAVSGDFMEEAPIGLARDGSWVIFPPQGGPGWIVIPGGGTIPSPFTFKRSQ